MLWKQIPGFFGYEICVDGRVRRSPNVRLRGWGRKRPPGSLLHPCYNGKKDSYIVVRLRDDAGKNRVCKVHQLIARTFHGPRPSPFHCSLHKDDDKDNNHANNIYWGTKKQNSRDKLLNGRGLNKLDLEEALWAKELYYGDAWSTTELAILFDVSISCVRGLLRGKTYKWIHPNVV